MALSLAFVGLVQGGHELHHLLLRRTGDAQVGGDLVALEGTQAHAGVHALLQDLVRVVFGHLLDVHAAFGAVDDHVASAGAVQQHAHVVLLGLAGAGVVHVLGDEHLVHLLPLAGGVCGVFSIMPMMASAFSRTSSMFLASFTPPPLPRPPAWICAFTTHHLVPVSWLRRLAWSTASSAL
jgi:hypothetical protein